MQLATMMMKKKNLSSYNNDLINQKKNQKVAQKDLRTKNMTMKKSKMSQTIKRKKKRISLD